MKRSLVCVLIAFSMIFALGVISFADGFGFALEAKSDYASASKGDEFSVSFFATNIAERNGILSLTAEVYYDPAHIDFISVEEIVPSKWGRKYFIYSPEELKGNKMVITVILCYDGEGSWDSAGVSEDETLGFKLNFNVVTSSKTKTTIDVPSELLEATNNTSDFSAASGIGTTYTIALNGAAAEESSQASQDLFYSIDPNASEEEPYIPPVFGSEDTSIIEDISSASAETSEIWNSSSYEPAQSGATSSETETSENSEASENAESETDESSASLTESNGETSEISGEASSDNSSAEEKDEGVNVVLLLVIACIVVAAIAVSVYIIKNKKDDMNPVNPG